MSAYQHLITQFHQISPHVEIGSGQRDLARRTVVSPAEPADNTREVENREPRLKFSHPLPITQLQGNTVERGTEMRIDLNPWAMPGLGRSGEAASGTKPGDMTRLAAPNAEDVAHLSSGSDAIQRLKLQLDALPDVRQERVDALRQAISAGRTRFLRTR
jgi:flagellar biosynthesis anti-sigma factor FlgM